MPKVDFTQFSRDQQDILSKAGERGIGYISFQTVFSMGLGASSNSESISDYVREHPDQFVKEVEDRDIKRINKLLGISINIGSDEANRPSKEIGR